MQGGAGLTAIGRRIQATVERARAVPALAQHAEALVGALEHVVAATRAAWSTADPEEALANATPYLQAFGHMVLAWIWLDVAIQAKADAAKAVADEPLLRGLLAACTYFFHYELPRIGAWLRVVETRDATCRSMAEDWF